jgi:hypothetical protein
VFLLPPADDVSRVDMAGVLLHIRRSYPRSVDVIGERVV